MIAVVGAGKSGLAVANHAILEGCEVVLYDDLELREVRKRVTGKLSEKVLLREGMPGLESGKELEKIVVSPGIPLSRLPLDDFEERGVEVIGEVEYAYRHLDGHITAITGTNGKSTVTALLGTILEKEGFRTFTGGNLKDPLTSACGGDFEMCVVELSSFQLESVKTFRPSVAILLNLGEDHLDRYSRFTEYTQAKGAIFRNQLEGDAAIYNDGDSMTGMYAGKSKGKKYPFGMGMDKGIGAWVSGDILSIETRKIKGRFDISSSSLKGNHNRENIAAAALGAALSGASERAIREGILEFPGLPHRMQFVASVEGVTYINDSKGTNVHSLCSALRGVEGKVVLIAGGRDKGVSFLPAGEVMRGKVRSLILIGEASPRIVREVGPGVNHKTALSLDDAVSIASQDAVRGDTVLLSPGCSSFDMFASFEERGEKFQEAVRRLCKFDQKN